MADNNKSAEEALRRALEEAMANIDYNEEEDDEDAHPTSNSASEDSDDWVAPVAPEDLLHGIDNDADSVDEYVVFSLPDDNEQQEERERQVAERIPTKIETKAKREPSAPEYKAGQPKDKERRCEISSGTMGCMALIVVAVFAVAFIVSIFCVFGNNTDSAIDQMQHTDIVEDALVVDVPASSTNAASLLSDVFSNAYYGNPDTYGVLLPSSTGHLIEPVGDSEVMMQIANDENIVQVVSCSCTLGTHRYDVPSSHFMGTGLIVVEAQEGDVPSAYVWKRYQAMFNKEILCIVVLPKEELEYLQETLTENDPKHNMGYIEVVGETDEGTMEYVEEILGK